MELCPHRVVVVQRSAPWPKVHVKCHLSPTKATAQLLEAVVDGGEIRTHTLSPCTVTSHVGSGPLATPPAREGYPICFLAGLT